jgi:hypothetical protein
VLIDDELVLFSCLMFSPPIALFVPPVCSEILDTVIRDQV